MPYVRIEVPQGLWADRRRALLEAVDSALIDTLGIAPGSAFLRLYEYDPGQALVPADGLVLVEMALFPGRLPETKNQLYRAVVEQMEAVGVPRASVSIVLYEVARGDWGLGGVPGSVVYPG